jgi:hypothetical protein
MLLYLEPLKHSFFLRFEIQPVGVERQERGRTESKNHGKITLTIAKSGWRF